ncbi:PBP1A family penicillin-binding protein [Peribacillus deserti]|uniref:Penicillin-binding protein n=1 Tax=Peribacillus deserti TaxID=673318 RepID=A0A2N5M1X2_9BACI|nr:PBP1A family penicillin-binding protein [Peribacillus deserti]PLT28368.1 penicillin-binding protein [Peribacillus deserti]
MAQDYKTREERRKQQTQAKNKKKGKAKPAGMFKRVFLLLIALGITGMVLGGATFAYFAATAPKLSEGMLKDPVSSKIYDKNKKLIKEIGKENREYIPYDEIPPSVVDATIATEDARFFEHHGVDLRRLGSAVVANITNGFGSQGASTITQQLVKRSFLTPEKTIKRKVQELWISLQIERKYTKEQIFEMYVNKIYYGEGAYGISTAAKTYFNKPLKDLTLPEVATLVGLPQSPSNYSPFDNPDQAEKRRNVVLTLMERHGYISNAELTKAKASPVKTLVVKEEQREKNTEPYNAFIDHVINEVEDMGDYNVYTDGLEIYTTMDPKAQEHVYEMMSSDQFNFPDEKFQAGITLLDTKTGEIRALGGGRNIKGERNYNYATQIQRQPGSTIKPIVDYGPAIEYLNWSTYEQVVDEPYKYSNGTPINNYNDQFRGQMTIREALGRSLNIPALKAFQAVGLDKAREFANGLGMPFKKDEFFESASIGGISPGISPLQLAGAYSAFGNNGIYNKPHAITKIVVNNTEIKTAPEPKVAMKESTAFMVTDMLKSVVKSPYGTGSYANVPDLPVAGKTGTTNYSEEEIQSGIPESAVPDAWFAGYTTNYTAAIWTGYGSKKDYIPAENEYQKIAQKMFRDLMGYVSQDKETPDFKQPKSVVQVKVEQGSNPPKLASDYTPESNISYEYFVRGHQPTEVSKEYEKPKGPGNLQASYDPDSNQISLTWDYDGEEKKPEFEVKVALNDGADSVLTVTKENGLKMENPQAGGTYKFTVSAISGDSRSDSASTTVQIPKTEEDPAVPGEENKDNTQEDPNQNQDQENGQNQEDTGEEDAQQGDDQQGEGGENGVPQNGEDDANTEDPSQPSQPEQPGTPPDDGTTPPSDQNGGGNGTGQQENQRSSNPSSQRAEQ